MCCFYTLDAAFDGDTLDVKTRDSAKLLAQKAACLDKALLLESFAYPDNPNKAEKILGEVKKILVSAGMAEADISVSGKAPDVDASVADKPQERVVAKFVSRKGSGNE